MYSSQEQNNSECNNPPLHSLNLYKGNSMINNPPPSPSLFKNSSELFGGLSSSR